MNQGLLTAQDSIASIGRWTSPAFTYQAGPTPEWSHPFEDFPLTQLVLRYTNVAANGVLPGDNIYHGPSTSGQASVNYGYNIQYPKAGSLRLMMMNNGIRWLTPNAASGAVAWSASSGVFTVSAVGAMNNSRPSNGFQTLQRHTYPDVSIGTAVVNFQNKTGRLPAIMWPKLRCIAPELGYQPGDVVDFSLSNIYSASQGTGVVMIATPNRITVGAPSGANGCVQAVVPKMGGTLVNITNAKWRLFVETLT